MMQVPIGLEEKLEGMVDLVTMKAMYFDGNDGETLRIEEIPAHLVDEANERREIMLDTVSMFSDDLMEKMMEGDDIPEEMINEAIRKGTLSLELCPVYLGSAYKNKGIQPLLDAVLKYLPCPTDVENRAPGPGQGRRGSCSSL